MSNPYTITSPNEMNESMVEAMAEISLLLRAANGGPLPKKH